MTDSLTEQGPSTWVSMSALLMNNTDSTLPRSNPFELLSNNISNPGRAKSSMTETPIWVVPMLGAYLLSYTAQLGLLMCGIYFRYRCKAWWLYRKNRYSLILPNTQVLIALWSFGFVMVQFIDTVFLVVGTQGRILARERFRISGFEWLALWQSGWVLLWGISACFFVTAYKQGGFIGRIVGERWTAPAFNLFFMITGALAALSQLITFGVVVLAYRTIASQSMDIIRKLAQLAAEYNPETYESRMDLFPEIISAMRLRRSVAKYGDLVGTIVFIRLVWSLLLVLLLVPFGIIHIRTLLKLRNFGGKRDSTTSPQRTHSGTYDEDRKQSNDGELGLRRTRESSVASISSSTPLKVGHIDGAKSHIIANAILVFLHSAIYILLFVGSLPSLNSPNKQLRERVSAYQQLAYVGKGLFAVVGLWSSSLFLRVSRQNYLAEKGSQKLIITAHKEVTASFQSSPNGLNSFRFPDKQGFTRPIQPTDV